MVFLAAEPEGAEKIFEFGEVAFADFAGPGQEFRSFLQPGKFDHALKWKFQFVRVEHLKDDDFVTAEPEVPDAFENFALVVKKIADENHDAAPASLDGEFVEDLADAGAAGGFERGEPCGDFKNHVAVAGARNIGARAGVENIQADGVALE